MIHLKSKMFERVQQQSITFKTNTFQSFYICKVCLSIFHTKAVYATGVNTFIYVCLQKVKKKKALPLVSLSRAQIFSLSPLCSVLSACKCPICSCSSNLTWLTSATFSWSLPESSYNNTPTVKHPKLVELFICQFWRHNGQDHGTVALSVSWG